jgi:hypothetical protein
MLAQITRILLCLALCLMLGCHTCRTHQDVARIDLYDLRKDSHIDSVVMKSIDSDSIVGCRYYWNTHCMVIGSKTHRVKFPIVVRIQLFSQGDLRKELFFEVDKNTWSKISSGTGCSASSNPQILTDDYCVYIEKIDSEDYLRCMEVSVDRERGFCYEREII